MLVGLLLNAGLWIGAALLSCVPFRDIVTRILATVVVGFCLIVVMAEVLSSFGLFRLVPVAFCCAVLTILGCTTFALLRKTRRLDDSETRTPDVVQISQHRLAVRAVCLLVLAAAGWMACDSLLFGLLNPVQVDSDAPIYHLPFAIHWSSVGRLEMIPTPFGEEGAPYFPANGDLWLSWLALTTSGAAIIKVGQWMFMVVSGLALFGIAREIEASRESAAIVAGLWCWLPLTLRQASVANVDLIWTAFYFIAVLFTLRVCAVSHSQGPRVWNLALAALSMGLVLGTKSLGLVFLPPLLLPIAWSIMTHLAAPERSAALSSRLCELSVLVSGLILPSIYWYARNAWLTGNPLYPLNVAPAGFQIFAGVYDGAAMRQTAYHVSVFEWHVLLTRLRTSRAPYYWACGLSGC